MKNFVLVKIKPSSKGAKSTRFEYVPALAFYRPDGRWISTHQDDLLEEKKLISLLEGKLAEAKK